MSWNNKVVWTEGMLLRPHHFQQHTRYFENLIESRCNVLRNNAWGFTQLKIDTQLLKLGKFSIQEASGILPDGTPFNLPEDDEPPAPIDIPEGVRNSVVYLALPNKRYGALDIDSNGLDKSLARNWVGDENVLNNSLADNSSVNLQVGKLRLRFLLDTDPRDDYACLGVVRLVEIDVNKTIVLDDSYLPAVLNCHAAKGLEKFLFELKGMLLHRTEALAGRVTASGQGGSAEIADFLMLQLVNRYTPLVSHYSELDALHPEILYRVLLEIAGELATFTKSDKRASTFPIYNHYDLWTTFSPVMTAIRESLTTVLEQTAVPIPLKEKRYGIHVAVIADRSFYTNASFVLAISADMPVEELRNNFTSHVKIGAVEQIKELVNALLPGVRINSLPVAPRQIPYHSGYVYFELERGGQYWQKLTESSGLALHIGAQFPGLKMELWAIKG